MISTFQWCCVGRWRSRTAWSCPPWGGRSARRRLPLTPEEQSWTCNRNSSRIWTSRIQLRIRILLSLYLSESKILILSCILKIPPKKTVYLLCNINIIEPNTRGACLFCYREGSPIILPPKIKKWREEFSQINNFYLNLYDFKLKTFWFESILHNFKIVLKNLSFLFFADFEKNILWKQAVVPLQRMARILTQQENKNVIIFKNFVPGLAEILRRASLSWGGPPPPPPQTAGPAHPPPSPFVRWWAEKETL